MSSSKSFHLFGYPILHSASPAFHNHIFEKSEPNSPSHYAPHSTSKVTPEMLATIRSNDFGGCSVTMPIKSTIIPYLDDITEEGRVTGAVNTIVKVVLPGTGAKYIGTNTDILGVRNALVQTLSRQHPNEDLMDSTLTFPSGIGAAGVVIGGGATTRSAVYALHTLGLSPIYLVNRDKDEVVAVQQALAHLNIIHLAHPDEVEAALGHKVSSTPRTRILIVVGAIPAMSPQTYEERLVYTTVSSILTIPYERNELTTAESTSKGKTLPLPTSRLFLEMAYKPRITPMLKIATALGWHPIDGIQAMIQQGYAQQRMWRRGDPSVGVGSDDRSTPVGKTDVEKDSILGKATEKSASELAIGMKDIIVQGIEADKAAGIDWASAQKLGSY